VSIVIELIQDNKQMTIVVIRLPYDHTTLPRTLCSLLDAYEPCAHCVLPCVLNYGEIIVPRQLSMHGITVHVTAANQSFAVPVQERYCSLKCFHYGLKRAGNISIIIIIIIIAE
jgi:hypothetical protein